jgi:hypothetical protein
MYEFTSPPVQKQKEKPSPVVEKDDRPMFVAVSKAPSLKLRELMLTWPGERAIDLIDLPSARLEGYEPVALVWHSADGSWREPWPKN